MRLLLDTPVLLWWLADDRRLGTQARALIANADKSFAEYGVQVGFAGD